MKKLAIISLQITVIVFCFSINAYTQNNSNLCICFNSNTKYIDLSFSEDSTLVAFNIAREGYETEEKREEVKKEYENKFPRIPIPIQFYYNYYSVNKPQIIDTIKEVDDCIDLVSVYEYRRKDFSPPKNASSNLAIFIQRLPNGTYLKWEAIIMAIE